MYTDHCRARDTYLLTLYRLRILIVLNDQSSGISAVHNTRQRVCCEVIPAEEKNG